MGQIKIYGHRKFLETSKGAISDAIHRCTVGVLGLPKEKRFHRFLPLEAEFFIHPADRSERYIIIEISLMAGRSVETRKEYIKALIETLHGECGILKDDIEITLLESPRENWGLRGFTGDALVLNYTVEK